MISVGPRLVWNRSHVRHFDLWSSTLFYLRVHTQWCCIGTLSTGLKFSGSHKSSTYEVQLCIASSYWVICAKNEHIFRTINAWSKGNGILYAVVTLQNFQTCNSQHILVKRQPCMEAVLLCLLSLWRHKSPLCVGLIGLPPASSGTNWQQAVSCQLSLESFACELPNTKHS